MNEELIKMINKAFGLVYDTVHPMPKVEISQILSKIKTELSKESNPTEFTKWLRAIAAAIKYKPEKDKLGDLEAEAIGQAADAIEQLQTEFKAQQSVKERLTETLLRIDNYCRVNDIDLERAMEG